MRGRLIEMLTDASPLPRVEALPQLRKLDTLPEHDKLEFLKELAKQLSSQSAISDRECAVRFAAALEEIALTSGSQRDLAIALADAKPPIKNAMSATLPPELRPLLYQLGTTHLISTGRVSDGVGSAGLEPHFSKSAVVLLATSDQSANHRLLDKAGFSSLRADSVSELTRLLENGTDICGVVVDGSFLASATVEQQRDAFERLFSFSTFCWVRVHEEHLRLTQAEVRQIAKQCCCRDEIPGQNLSFRESSTIREAELSSLDEAANFLKAYDSTKFTISEFEDETVVLAASAASFASRRNMRSQVEVLSVKTQFLQGGNTTARVVKLRINETGAPVVAKIDSRDRVVDEVQRFREFVRSWDTKLLPEAFFHGRTGVIVFSLVDDVGDPMKPAPSLEDCLNYIWYRDLYGEDIECIAAERLEEAIGNAARKLSQLNIQKAHPGQRSSVGSPSLIAVRRIEAAGYGWGFPKEFLRKRDEAEIRYNTHTLKGLVHGDLHLRNVLIRGEVEAYLIDYACTGVGHPARDLVRLELALCFGACRQVADEDEIVKIQRAITFDNVGVEELVRTCPALCRLPANRVAMAGVVAARNKVREVLETHQMSQQDYIDAKLFEAWSSLTVNNLNSAFVRGTIKALSA